MAVVFTVEDGTGVANANAYCTVSYADDYLSIKSNDDDWQELADSAKESYIMWATRLLDQRATYQRGTTRSDADQSLAWPRMNVIDREGIAIPDDIIPDQIQEAVVEIAFNLFDQQVDPSSGGSSGSSGGVINKIKVAVIEIGYSDGVAATTSPFPKGLNDILYPLGFMPGSGGSRGVPIRRA